MIHEYKCSGLFSLRNMEEFVQDHNISFQILFPRACNVQLVSLLGSSRWGVDRGQILTCCVPIILFAFYMVVLITENLEYCSLVLLSIAEYGLLVVQLVNALAQF